MRQTHRSGKPSSVETLNAVTNGCGSHLQRSDSESRPQWRTETWWAGCRAHQNGGCRNLMAYRTSITHKTYPCQAGKRSTRGPMLCARALTCVSFTVALGPGRGQRVGDRVGVLVRSMFVEIVEGSIVLAGLVGEDYQVHAVAGVRAGDD